MQLTADETYADITPIRPAGAISAGLSIMRGCNNMCVPFAHASMPAPYFHACRVIKRPQTLCGKRPQTLCACVGVLSALYHTQGVVSGAGWLPLSLMRCSVRLVRIS